MQQPVQLSVSDFLAQARTKPVFDVRSPAEYAHAHMPGAISLPLFSDAERAQVGTTYKQQGQEAAILLGLALVGPKLADLVRQAKTQNSREVLVHCWRGGMRSGSMAWLLQTAGFSVATLAGGYKAYRNTVLASFEKPQPLLLLGGYTGSGKTDMLKALAQLGEHVINLEALAHHKGSSYGGIGQQPQPSNEQFENELHHHWHTLNPNRRLWLEDESRNVGNCFIPQALWQQLQAAPVLFLDVAKPIRIRRLVADYTGINHQLLLDATERIRRRLGHQLTDQALEALRQHDYATVADVTLTYYDKAYRHSLSRRNPETVFPFPISDNRPLDTARQLIAWANANKPQLGLKTHV